MAKRSWSQANPTHSPEEAVYHSPASSGLSHPASGLANKSNGHHPSQSGVQSVRSGQSVHNVVTPSDPHVQVAADGFTVSSETSMRQLQQLPAISRKIKACAACRKQKIKCIMDDQSPPCRRCLERNLSCVLNKSLQTIIDEGSRRTTSLHADLENMHSSLQSVLKQLHLPALPSLQSVPPSEDAPVPSERRTEDGEEPLPLDIDGPTCDNSPQLSPQEDDALLPIESLYQVTRLRALRKDQSLESPASQGIHNDFIARGLISIADAERLTQLYLNRLDHFMYGIGGRYKDLDSLRHNSPILTACICAVAALHDADAGRLYAICNTEFRHLMAASMFERRVDRDHLRAMVVASYWMSDISWTTSGYAIRRATEVNLSASYHRVLATNSEDAADCLRLFYILFICDQHLSTLYGRPAIVRDNLCIQGFEAFLNAPIATDDDKRLLSQVSLVSIISSIRELFGPDTGQRIPRAFVVQIASYSRQLDQWLNRWRNTIPTNHPSIGKFPVKGAILHYHFAKLHLYSHVFRGLGSEPIPTHLRDAALSAVSAATTIIELLLADTDLRDSVVGVPHYMHTMIAFACVFLMKIAVKYREELIESAVVYDMTSRLVQQFRSAHTGKYHLVHLMVDGLEKMNASRAPGTFQHNNSDAFAAMPTLDYEFSASMLPQFDLDHFDPSNAGFGFL